jgi:TolB protein
MLYDVHVAARSHPATKESASMKPVSGVRSGFVFALALLTVAVGSMLVPGQAGAAFPGENGKIAFFRQGDIFVIEPDGSGETNLTGEASGGDPNWSPDGSRIVYESLNDGNFEIYVMNADGSNQTRLTDNPAFDSRPAWSADGSQIYFQSTRDGNFEVYVMNADGSNQTRLTDNPAFDGATAPSPDGSTIAFTSDRDGNQEIYTMNPDGSGQTNLTNDPANNTAANWSPDGSRIVFTTVEGGQGDLFVMDADGSDQANLTNTPAVNESSPAWSPDGTQITYTAPVEVGINIFVMDADGSNPTRVTQSTVTERDPDWQPLATEAPPTTTSTTLMPPGELIVTIDDEVVTNGSVGQVKGTVACAAGELFIVRLDLTQDGAAAQGTARGSCTGSPQSYTIGFASRGAAFDDGVADACVTTRTGVSGSRDIIHTAEVCEEVVVGVRSR